MSKYPGSAGVPPASALENKKLAAETAALPGPREKSNGNDGVVLLRLLFDGKLVSPFARGILVEAAPEKPWRLGETNSVW